jgi:hypothetical protein
LRIDLKFRHIRSVSRASEKKTGNGGNPFHRVTPCQPLGAFVGHARSLF